MNAVAALARQPEEAFAGGVKSDNGTSIRGKAAQASPCVTRLYEWNVDHLFKAVKPFGENHIIWPCVMGFDGVFIGGGDHQALPIGFGIPALAVFSDRAEKWPVGQGLALGWHGHKRGRAAGGLKADRGQACECADMIGPGACRVYEYGSLRL